jgi:hypothetical protein
MRHALCYSQAENRLGYGRNGNLTRICRSGSTSTGAGSGQPRLGAGCRVAAGANA